MWARSLNGTSLIPSNEVPVNEWSLNMFSEQWSLNDHNAAPPTPRRRAHQSMIPARHSYRPSQDALETLKTRHLGHQNKREPSIQPCPNGRAWGALYKGMASARADRYKLRKNSA